MKCKICGNEVNGRSNRVYCSRKCKDHNTYLNAKDRYKKNTKKWIRNNPERHKEINKRAVDKYRTEKRKRFNKIVMKSYYRHKDKWISRKIVRDMTLQIKKPLEIEKKCGKCGSKENLSLKFEVYPRKADEIRQAAKDGMIYYICKECRWK